MQEPLFEERPFPAEPLLVWTGEPKPEWIDYNGHMNVGYYTLAFDRAIDPLYDDWIDLGEAYAARERMGPFALQMQTHYLREVRLGDRLEVRIIMLEVDAKRWNLIALMERPADGALCAAYQQVSANVSHVTRRSAPLPEAQRRRLEAMRDAQAGVARPPQVGARIGLAR